MVKGRPLGVLEVVNKIGDTHYTEDDAIILETLAAPAALAVHNADLQRRIEAGDSEIAELDRLKSDFIAITSHELRTPLGLILGHATFLRELLSEEYHEQIDIIIKNASRLKEIIEVFPAWIIFKAARPAFVNAQFRWRVSSRMSSLLFPIWPPSETLP